MPFDSQGHYTLTDNEHQPSQHDLWPPSQVSALTCQSVIEEGPYAKKGRCFRQPSEGQVWGRRRREVGNVFCPRRVRLRTEPDGAWLFGGCGWSSCEECRLYRLKRRESRIAAQVSADIGSGVMYLFGGVTRREEEPGDLLIKERRMAELSGLAFRQAKRPRPTIRGGRAPWPGCLLDYVRGPGVHKSGVGHDHRLIRYAPAPGARLPPVSHLRDEVSHNLSRAVMRELAKAGRADLEGVKMVNVYLDVCEDVSAVTHYLLFNQNPEPGQPVPAISRRSSSSRGFFKKGAS